MIYLALILALVWGQPGMQFYELILQAVLAHVLRTPRVVELQIPGKMCPRPGPGPGPLLGGSGQGAGVGVGMLRGAGDSLP